MNIVVHNALKINLKLEIGKEPEHILTTPEVIPSNFFISYPFPLEKSYTNFGQNGGEI